MSISLSALQLLLSAGQSVACAYQTDLARTRRCADPGRSVAALAASICLQSAPRRLPGRLGDTGRAAVGRDSWFNSGKEHPVARVFCLVDVLSPISSINVL